MATASMEYQEVVTRVRSWEPQLRLALAEELLRSLHPDVVPNLPRGIPAEQVRGMAAGETPPPDDNTVRRWVEEYRLGKHG
jgi:hypothetical protein